MNQRRFLGLGISILGVLVLSRALVGQVSKESEAGFPTDWSHHQLIFSKPGTAEQVQRVQQDPRYWQQVARRSAAKSREAKTAGALAPELQIGSRAVSGEIRKINKDWIKNLGPSGSVGAANFPAKYSFRPTAANCAGGAAQPDFVVFGTGVPGSTNQATILAYDNLYSGCPDLPVPTDYWAYNTGTGGTVNTSPVLSIEGNQIAFVQLNGLTSNLVLLKWAESGSETVSSPRTLTGVTAAAYFTCATTPCMTALPLRSRVGAIAERDTYSSVFYDYAHDTAYVGDDGGYLHKFSPVFQGTPAEVTNAQWPVLVNSGAPTPLTSPVYDSLSKDVFVGDNGGYLYLIDSAGAIIRSGQLDFSSTLDHGPGLVAGPVVDSTTGYVYVFATSDGSRGCLGLADCTAVYELKISTFATGDTGSEAPPVGSSSIEGTEPNPMFTGIFDSTYENSTGGTGNIYVCGNTGGPPILYQLSIDSGTLGSVSNGPVISNDTTPCSPVTDFLNPNVPGGATEWIFASVEGGGVSTACGAGGCIYNFKDTPWVPNFGYSVGQEIVDTNFRIQFVSHAGTSGASAPPTWSAIGGTTDDGSVLKWLDIGPLNPFPLSSWAGSTPYNNNQEILDGNGNVEFVTVAGTSGGSVTFNMTVGGTTSDGTVTWLNVGLPPTAASAQPGGTSGIIVDNYVETLTGASQIYFSTLGGCEGPSDLDGCAVQLSQSTLQ
jgi:hypothetical protein